MSSLEKRLAALKEEIPCDQALKTIKAINKYQASPQGLHDIQMLANEIGDCMRERCGMPCLQMIDRIHAMTNNVIPLRQEEPRKAA